MNTPLCDRPAASHDGGQSTVNRGARHTNGHCWYTLLFHFRGSVVFKRKYQRWYSCRNGSKPASASTVHSGSIANSSQELEKYVGAHSWSGFLVCTAEGRRVAAQPPAGSPMVSYHTRQRPALLAIQTSSQPTIRGPSRLSITLNNLHTIPHHTGAP